MEELWLMMTTDCFDAVVGWQEGHPACKNWVVGCWHGYLSGVRWGADLHMAQKIQIGFTFLVLVPVAHPGSPRQNPEEPQTIVV